MDESIPIHPFESFPREDLSPGLTRRQFFKTLAVELKVFAQRSEGANAVKIPSLGSMPDNDLYEIIPRVLPGSEFDLKEGQVWAKAPSQQRLIPLFPYERLSLYSFNLINGQNSLRQIAIELSLFSGLPFERAFAFTRGLFLTLVKHGVCLPTNNPFLG
jgi:hypothetical protein